jgi:hypothetical protein
MKTGIELVAQEREEQVKKHGFTLQHDADSHEEGVLIDVVGAILSDSQPKDFTLGWEKFSGKITKKTYKEKLIIASALLVAEIDRLQTLGK